MKPYAGRAVSSLQTKERQTCLRHEIRVSKKRIGKLSEDGEQWQPFTDQELLCDLKELEESEEIESLFDKLKPIGNQPAQLYGLAKVYKKKIPARPVLSIAR